MVKTRCSKGEVADTQAAAAEDASIDCAFQRENEGFVAITARYSKSLDD